VAVGFVSALVEETGDDSKSQNLTGTFMGYALPPAGSMPAQRV